MELILFSEKLFDVVTSNRLLLLEIRFVLGLHIADLSVNVFFESTDYLLKPSKLLLYRFVG